MLMPTMHRPELSRGKGRPSESSSNLPEGARNHSSDLTLGLTRVDSTSSAQETDCLGPGLEPMKTCKGCYTQTPKEASDSKSQERDERQAALDQKGEPSPKKGE